MMTRFDRILRTIGLQRTSRANGREGRRSYDAAGASRLLSDWFAGYTSGDAELRASLRRIIARTRDLARNNDYVRAFNGLAVRNVIGSAKYDLRMDVHDILRGGEKKPDDLANRLIEEAWFEWSKKKNCTPAGDKAWRAIQIQALVSCITDGAVLYRHIRGAAAGNRFGYAVQLLEIDQLDLDRHQNLPDGGTIRFGVEKGPSGRIRAFHVYTAHPGDDLPLPTGANRETIRIPASEMGILQLPGRITETLSTPWLISCVTRLRHLGAYEEAEVIAARVGACKGGFFTRNPEGGASYVGDDTTGPTITDAEPGHFEQLPAGMDFKPYDPTHPNTAFGEFRKAMLRGCAASQGATYHIWASDMESVNLSSARVGVNEERETWKGHQLWFVEDFKEIIFEEALLMFLTSGAVNLPLAKFDKFNAPSFKQRRWGFYDPVKDMKAAELGIALRVTSRTQTVDENGGDIETTYGHIKNEEALAAKMGISLAPPDPTPSGSAQVVTTGNGTTPAPDDDEEDDEE